MRAQGAKPPDARCPCGLHVHQGHTNRTSCLLRLSRRAGVDRQRIPGKAARTWLTGQHACPCVPRPPAEQKGYIRPTCAIWGQRAVQVLFMEAPQEVRVSCQASPQGNMPPATQNWPSRRPESAVSRVSLAAEATPFQTVCIPDAE